MSTTRLDLFRSALTEAGVGTDVVLFPGPPRPVLLRTELDTLAVPGNPVGNAIADAATKATSAGISDATSIGRSVLTGAAVAGRTALGLGAAAVFAPLQIADGVNLRSFLGHATDTEQLNAALAFCAANGVKLIVPPGVYNLTGVIGVTTNLSALVIEGVEKQSIFRWAAAPGGLAVTYQNVNYPPKITGMTFETGVAAGGTGLNISGPFISSFSRIGPEVTKCEFAGVDTTTHYWSINIEFGESWYPVVRGCTIKGKATSAPPFVGIGVSAVNAQAVTLAENVMFHLLFGYKVAGIRWGEGLAVYGGEMVGVHVGIENALAFGRSGIAIRNTHINAYFRCIVMDGQSDMAIHDNLLFKTHLSTLDWQAIEIRGGARNNIHDNSIAAPGATAGGCDGITILNSDDNHVHHNTFHNWQNVGVGVLVVGTSDFNTILNNRRPINTAFPGVMVVTSAGRAGNIVRDNFPLPAQTLPINSATPSVGNKQHDFFSTANTAATSITAITGLRLGESVTIMVNDSNTTFINADGSFYLRGSANILPASTAGVTFTFLNTGSRVVEVSRSGP